MGKADLHIHTTHSYDGTATVAATLEHVMRHTDLEVIAITDHDQIDGALQAVELAPQYGIEVIPGSEVSTADGHVLALFVREAIPAGLSLLETVHCIAAQDGLCIAAHPGGWWRWCLKETTIRTALADPVVAKTLVGLEAYNASLPDLGANSRAHAVGQRLRLTPVGNSDAHMLWMIGMAATYFPGHDALALKRALVEQTTQPIISTRPAYFYASYVGRQLLRLFGIAQWSPTLPGGPIALRRLAGVHP
jgi:predicted metal-dependent phosphoesterase TrpH